MTSGTRVIIRIAPVVVLLAVVGVLVALSLRPPGPRDDETSPPVRIVSVAPSVTETLFALGVGDNVVAVTEWCDYPPEAKAKPKVGGYINFSTERVVAYAPDLVIGAHGIPIERLERLKALNIRVFAEDPKTFEEVLAQIRTLGWITGSQKRAEEIVAQMRTDIDAVTSRVATVGDKPKPRVMYGSWEAPIFVAGPGNFIDEVIRMAGGTNIAADAGTLWPTGYSIEKIIAHDPEIIIRGYYPGRDNVSMGARARTIESLRKNPVWKNLTAVKTGRVYWIDENLVVRPGPRLTEGLKEVARLIHPNLFTPTETQP